jgi:Xaa-Pro aminopeptidase
MGLDVQAVQAALAADGLDGWLLYDFHGSNPIARRVCGLADGVKMTTRRWYYLVPATGAPRGLVHAIERHNLDHLPGDKAIYAGRRQLEEGLRSLVSGRRRVAMEFSPRAAIPYISRVDGGTVDLIRELGAEVVSSGDLVQRFEAAWDAAEQASHRAASERLYRVKDRAFGEIARRVATDIATDEYEIQQLMTGWFREEGLVSDSAPVVAAQENAGNPHYLPLADRRRAIGRDELVLLDLWGKLDTPGAVYADITWTGFTGTTVPDRVGRVFETVCAARDAAVELVQRSAAAGSVLLGWQVDRAARGVLDAAGFGAHVLHRTGHSLGVEVHGNGVHMDDYETRDERRLLDGTGFTVEPGLYFDDFGIRTEINMIYGQTEAAITGPVQRALMRLV